jgi:hypothetical protein
MVLLARSGSYPCVPAPSSSGALRSNLVSPICPSMNSGEPGAYEERQASSWITEPSVTAQSARQRLDFKPGYELALTLQPSPANCGASQPLNGWQNYSPQCVEPARATVNRQKQLQLHTGDCACVRFQSRLRLLDDPLNRMPPIEPRRIFPTPTVKRIISSKPPSVFPPQAHH